MRKITLVAAILLADLTCQKLPPAAKQTFGDGFKAKADSLSEVLMYHGGDESQWPHIDEYLSRLSADYPAPAEQDMIHLLSEYAAAYRTQRYSRVREFNRQVEGLKLSDSSPMPSEVVRLAARQISDGGHLSDESLSRRHAIKTDVAGIDPDACKLAAEPDSGV